MTSFRKKSRDTSTWLGEKIVLKNTTQLDDLLSKGYEIIDRDFNLESHRIENGEFETNVESRLLLKKDNSLLNANTDLLGLYPMQFEWLYDFEKKRLVCTFMPDQSVHSELETIIIDLVAPRTRRPLKINKPDLNNNQKIFQFLHEFVKSEKNLKYVGYPKLNLSDIFSQVLIINENGNTINIEIVSKEKISMKEIRKLKTNSDNNDNCLALSFFHLTKKISKDNQFNDALVGIILYDIKNKETLCFAIVSSSYFYQFHFKNKRFGLYDVVLNLFEECIDDQMNCKLFLPATIDHPWYTPLPWLYYAVLLPIQHDNNLSDTIKEERRISIPDYFIFGIPKWPANNDNFIFEHFSTFKEGRATCLFDFNAEKRITYPLRFDQSQGEPLVHLDFAFHDEKQRKLIAHRQLDLESVSNFNLHLYGAILAAGYFDGFFSTIIKKGIKGVEELRRKNPAYLYPLKIMWQVETAIIWLNENGGYEILEKVEEQTLTSDELKLVKKMSDDHLTLIAKDRDGKQLGLTPIGYIVLHRHLYGQKDLSLNS